jgi:hypothetical protein
MNVAIRRARPGRAVARPPLGAIALLGICLLATACGGGAHSLGATPSQGRVQQLDTFAQCMRSHGEPDFYLTSKQDLPTSISSQSVLSIMGEVVTGIDPRTPQFQSAMSACKHLLPGGGPQPVSLQQKEQMLQAAACMRLHGFPGYPDPVFPSTGGIGVPALPAGIDTNSPQFQAAQKTCGA